MADIYGDIDSATVDRALRIERTVRRLCETVEAQHPEDVAASSDPLVLDDAHLESTRFFLLQMALQVFADTTGEERPSGRVFYDLTGSNGRMPLAAASFLPFEHVVCMEPLAGGRALAAALFRERDMRLARRWRRACC